MEPGELKGHSPQRCERRLTPSWCLPLLGGSAGSAATVILSFGLSAIVSRVVLLELLLLGRIGRRDLLLLLLLLGIATTLLLASPCRDSHASSGRRPRS